MQKDYHTQTPGQTLDSLDSSLQGLSQSQVVVKLQEHGKNQLTAKKRTPFIIRALRQFNDPLIMILIGAAIISGAITIYEGHPSDLVDVAIILGIVVLNAAIGLVQDGKAHTALEALKNMSQPFCNVVRDGVDSRISTVELVPGDIVKMEAGDNIPADIRLIECFGLQVVESALTGESTAVSKTPNTLIQKDLPIGDRTNMVFSGGQILNGRAIGVVVETGMKTQVGQIAAMIGDEPTQSTPLQKQLSKTAKWISLAILAFAIIIFSAAIINQDPVVDSFMTAVAIAVAAIPEGLPAVVTIVLAIGVRKMSQRNSIIRHMPAVEVLGRVQVICSDKTGTLTQNKMTVVELYTLQDGQYDSFCKPQSKAQQLLTKTLLYCNDTKQGDGQLLGDPTETALVEYAQKHNISIVNVKRIGELPFDSDRKLMSVVMQETVKSSTSTATVDLSTRNGLCNIKTAYTKGATDNMLKLCTHILDGDNIRAITPADINKILTVNDALSKRALRVLGAAIKTDNLDVLEHGMTFVGLVGMIDPPRPEVTAAIETCKKAGIKPIMITGDHATTATAIAQQIGIEGKSYTGQQLDAMTDKELDNCIMQAGIFARVSPQNKVRIVHSLKGKGLVVAMTGDGVNDAPSIKAADIGIGMGITGTDVSKGAADMVLVDDNFATIVGAVEEGRRIFSNIK
ncbi:MAG: HAD-IC family P-type ATPase, partial [Firmicutes bacterium]|nr:HAD-IC family P-type ATPase [Bacillota bacterium]